MSHPDRSYNYSGRSSHGPPPGDRHGGYRSHGRGPRDDHHSRDHGSRHSRNSGHNRRERERRPRGLGEFNYDDTIRPQRTPILESGWDRDATPDELEYRALHFTERALTANLSFQSTTQILQNLPLIEQAKELVANAGSYINTNYGNSSAAALGLLPAYVLEALKAPVHDTSNLPVLSSAPDRQANRVYVGGINATTTENDLKQFFYEVMILIPDRIPTKEPITNASQMIRLVQLGGTYAFIEFLHRSDAELALNLDGVMFHGQTLKLKPPKEMLKFYEDNPPKRCSVPVSAFRNVPQLYITGLPQYFEESQFEKYISSIAPIMSFHVGWNPDKSCKGYAFVIYKHPRTIDQAIPFITSTPFLGNRLQCTVHHQRPLGLSYTTHAPSSSHTNTNTNTNTNTYQDGYQDGYNNSSSTGGAQQSYHQHQMHENGASGEVSTIIELPNVVTREELMNEYDDVMTDTREYCSTFGRVVEVFGRETSLYIVYANTQEAVGAARQLAAKKFNNNPVYPKFISEEEYYKHVKQ